jgi:thiol-disulfide isomerase/thioredoxin
MKRLVINFSLFMVLALILSNFTACQKSTNTGNGPSGGNTETVVKESTAGENSSKYPPVPEAIANADIKMIDGTTLKVADKKGKVILINLWATWCGPCRQEMPTLVKMHTKYQDKGFEVIGLDSDEGESVEMIQDFAKNEKLNYPLGYADSALFRQFVKISGLQGIPQSILINRDGKMTGVFSGGGPRVLAKMEETVEKTVNE